MEDADVAVFRKELSDIITYVLIENPELWNSYPQENTLFKSVQTILGNLPDAWDIDEDVKLIQHLARLGYHLILADQGQDPAEPETYLYYDPLRSQLNKWLIIVRQHDDQGNLHYQALHYPFTKPHTDSIFTPNNRFHFPILG